jgi:hypothetical protein
VVEVKPSDLASYLEEFHSEYCSLANRLSPADRGALARDQRITQHCAFYVSTTRGAGYEYLTDAVGNVSIIDSAPIDELLFRDAPQWMFERGRLLGLQYVIDAHLQGLSIVNGLPFQMLAPSSAFLIDIEVRANATDPNGTETCIWRRGVSFAELATDSSLEYWSRENARHRAKEEIARELVFLQVKRAKQLDDVREAMKRSVLILGDFSPSGRERLAAIRHELHRNGYITIAVDEIGDLPYEDLRQKALFLASTCGFVVIDDSSRSGHEAEMPLIESNRFVTAVLRSKGADGSYVVRGMSAKSKVIAEYEYDTASLRDTVAEVARWAEATVATVGSKLNQLYPWRDSLD